MVGGWKALPTREPEKDELAGVLLDLATRPDRYRVAVRRPSPAQRATSPARASRSDRRRAGRRHLEFSVLSLGIRADPQHPCACPEARTQRREALAVNAFSKASVSRYRSGSQRSVLPTSRAMSSADVLPECLTRDLARRDIARRRQPSALKLPVHHRILGPLSSHVAARERT